jgi:hypothetical protein
MNILAIGCHSDELEIGWGGTLACKIIKRVFSINFKTKQDVSK